MDTIMMTPEEIEAMLRTATRPLPDRPGLWAFQRHDGTTTEIRVRWLDVDNGAILTTTAGEPVEDAADSGTWGRYLGPLPT